MLNSTKLRGFLQHLFTQGFHLVGYAKFLVINHCLHGSFHPQRHQRAS